MSKRNAEHDAFQRKALIALRAAARDALRLARETGTSCHVWKDGKILDLNPPELRKKRTRSKT